MSADAAAQEQPKPAKRPLGRPPFGCVLEDGKYKLTDEGQKLAVNRLEAHRERCRERYRQTRALLMEARPDLFKRRRRADRTKEGQTVLSQQDAEQDGEVASKE